MGYVDWVVGWGNRGGVQVAGVECDCFVGATVEELNSTGWEMIVSEGLPEISLSEFLVTIFRCMSVFMTRVACDRCQHLPMKMLVFQFWVLDCPKCCAMHRSQLSFGGQLFAKINIIGVDCCEFVRFCKLGNGSLIC